MMTFEKRFEQRESLASQIAEVRAALEKNEGMSPVLRPRAIDSNTLIKDTGVASGHQMEVTVGQMPDDTDFQSVQHLAADLRCKWVELQNRCSAVDLSATAAEVVALQQRVTDADAELSRLKAIIDEQQAPSGQEVTSLIALENRRAELLADAALGKDIKTELAHIEKELTAASKKINAEVDRELTLSVLNGRLTACQEQRDHLAKVHKYAVAGYLGTNALLAAEKYHDCAEELGVCISRLLALYILMSRFAPKDLDPSFGIIGRDLMDVELPGLAGDTDVAFRARKVDLDVVADREVETLKKEHGIILAL